MDLQISDLFALFAAGHSHMCYECLTNPCTEKLVICPSGISKCLSSTMVIEIGLFHSSHTTKGCAVKCQRGSMNLNLVKMSSSCCVSNFCNANDAPDPRTLVPNGKMCYSFDGLSCSKILRCSGTEDRCISATKNLGGQSTVVKGCVSKVFCDAIQLAEFSDVSCCEGNLCNRGERIIQSVKHNRDESVIRNVTQSVIESVTQSSTEDMHEAVTHIHDSYENGYDDDDDKDDNESVTQRTKYKGDDSVYQKINYKGDESVYKGFEYNGAPSVTQSLLFLCVPLLSFVLIV